jgi:hypothetical protein
VLAALAVLAVAVVDLDRLGHDVTPLVSAELVALALVCTYRAEAAAAVTALATWLATAAAHQIGVIPWT